MQKRNAIYMVWVFAILCFAFIALGIFVLPDDLSPYKKVIFGLFPSLFAGLMGAFIQGGGNTEAEFRRGNSGIKLNGSKGFALFIGFFVLYLTRVRD